ncbi:unnamed protein product, partial [Urochloa humidicola]
ASPASRRASLFRRDRPPHRSVVHSRRSLSPRPWTWNWIPWGRSATPLSLTLPQPRAPLARGTVGVLCSVGRAHILLVGCHRTRHGPGSGRPARSVTAPGVVAPLTIGRLTGATIERVESRGRGMKDDGQTSSAAEVLSPRLLVSPTSRVQELEKFSHYVARQIGFDDVNECPHLCTLAYDYLRKNKGYEDNIFAFFQNNGDPEPLIVKFIEELDKCILGYFSFHWNYATYIITQVLTVEGVTKRKFKNMVLEATREQRFERVTRSLKVTRFFSTLVEELKAIGPSSRDNSPRNDVMVPVAHCDRSPVLLLMGGGMGAGKSTVLKDILKEAFWSGASANSVVVEADAFKETDVIYRAISSRGHHNDMLRTAELVHQSSLDAASSLLVTALNEGRDVIMDGTLSWEPFVQQTIAMARHVHRQRYRMGRGYKVSEDGTITEEYWEPVEDSSSEEENEVTGRKPYRIELVGVICDAYLAVVRGIRKRCLAQHP